MYLSWVIDLQNLSHGSYSHSLLLMMLSEIQQSLGTMLKIFT